QKYTIIFSIENQKQKNSIENMFEETYMTNVDDIIPDKINIILKKFNRGFIFDKYILITPYDIDKTIKKDIKYKNTIKIGRKIKSYTELEDGDYIVHEMYGIGIYRGLKTLKTNGYTRDYIALEYMDKDKVYIPIDNIDKIYKYSSGMGSTPKLNKLNNGLWAKKKLETRNKIRDISGELIKLYTSRNKIKGIPYRDYEDEIKFAFDFPYTLTPDQEKTINEIAKDLKSVVPMDRLLCGDVGYGKTEVAFRAMFKTVINGFQVAYLCPTTILSKQQYQNALGRFKDFPIRIELLNRHTPQKKVTEILECLEKGTVDIVIGTHKLLNEKIKYKSLGLLVVDEEQRFGVSHKEKIKQMKNDINVLTLSATPIPRTLKMAMSGLRSLSILDTPPVNRYPIQTYVIEENELIMRDAIYKELTREGQIFILINTIDELERYKNKIQKLVPEAKIAIGHGQMTSENLNSIMEEFVEGSFDILMCTTIIETGIDIPNVNTIIIIDSDRFGLSQLYQIRGRVGRSDKIAYAYLMYNPAKILTETAIKRLNSIREFTELGSGYKIAMRDLAIRGAGDLLGSEQAGFIDAVGLDLYTKMVDEEVRKLGGEEIEEEQSTTTLNVDSHIKDEYVEDENIKIEIHKLINSIKNMSDLEKVKTELIDRFGRLDESIEIYMLEKCTEGLLERLEIDNVMQLQNKLTIVLPQKISDKLDGEKLFLEGLGINSKFEFSYKNKEIRISLATDRLTKNYIYYIYELLLSIETQLKDV
ncbi:MAG TPA: transcription-repair coupling factor, partial [Firmicutes bacterium]|nr:transcription-repair coupling factor [Bacillota bacterium]